MNRETILEMRLCAENHGLFVEKITETVMYVSDLKYTFETPVLFAMQPDKKCPVCGEYLLYTEDLTNSVCLNEDCSFCSFITAVKEYEQDNDGDPEEMLMPKQVESLRLNLIFNNNDTVENAFILEAFMEDVQKLYKYYYEEDFTLLMKTDKALDESTLGLATD